MLQLWQGRISETECIYLVYMGCGKTSYRRLITVVELEIKLYSWSEIDMDMLMVTHLRTHVSKSCAPCAFDQCIRKLFISVSTNMETFALLNLYSGELYFLLIYIPICPQESGLLRNFHVKIHVSSQTFSKLAFDQRRHSRQQIRSHVRKTLLIKINFDTSFDNTWHRSTIDVAGCNANV